jgi:hypothetical protein
MIRGHIEIVDRTSKDERIAFSRCAGKETKVRQNASCLSGTCTATKISEPFDTLS